MEQTQLIEYQSGCDAEGVAKHSDLQRYGYNSSRTQFFHFYIRNLLILVLWEQMQ